MPPRPPLSDHYHMGPSTVTGSTLRYRRSEETFNSKFTQLNLIRKSGKTTENNKIVCPTHFLSSLCAVVHVTLYSSDVTFFFSSHDPDGLPSILDKEHSLVLPPNKFRRARHHHASHLSLRKIMTTTQHQTAPPTPAYTHDQDDDRRSTPHNCPRGS